jgi:hypothetical protein
MVTSARLSSASHLLSQKSAPLIDQSIAPAFFETSLTARKSLDIDELRSREIHFADSTFEAILMLDCAACLDFISVGRLLTGRALSTPQRDAIAAKQFALDQHGGVLLEDHTA